MKHALIFYVESYWLITHDDYSIIKVASIKEYYSALKTDEDGRAVSGGL